MSWTAQDYSSWFNFRINYWLFPPSSWISTHLFSDLFCSQTDNHTNRQNAHCVTIFFSPPCQGASQSCAGSVGRGTAEEQEAVARDSKAWGAPCHDVTGGWPQGWGGMLSHCLNMCILYTTIMFITGDKLKRSHQDTLLFFPLTINSMFIKNPSGLKFERLYIYKLTMQHILNM